MYASESRGVGQRKSTREWNPMRDDYETSRNGSQMHDRDKRDIPLDHCRLHVTNIPQSINEQGLNAVFSKYGNLLECFLSVNPQLRYALIKYKSPGEAKMAMAQLNAAEPMRLRIQIARRSNAKTVSESHDDTASVISTSCQSVRQDNNSNMDMEHRDVDSACDDLYNTLLEEDDVDVAVELQRLRMQELKVQYLKERQQLRAITSKAGQTSSNKSVMAEEVNRGGNGDKERSTERLASHTSDAVSAATRYIQREHSRACLNCGIQSDYYCAQCKIAPYCSEHCQKNDWRHRHETVCRSLRCKFAVANENSRNDDSDGNNTVVCKPFPQLRRPYVNKTDSNAGPRRYQGDGAGGGGKFSKPQGNSEQEILPMFPAGHQPPGNSRPAKPQNTYNKSNKGHERRDPAPGARKSGNSIGYNKPSRNEEEEDWELQGSKVEAKPAKVKVPEMKPVEVKPPAPVAVPKVEPKEAPAAVPVKPVVPPVAKAVPAKTLVPKKYLVETLNLGEQVVLSVEAEARDCAVDGGGFVCLSMHDTAASGFEALIDPYKSDCDADGVEIKVTPGDVFSFYKVEDGYWYRARCLSGNSVALIDNATVTAPFGSANKPRRLTDKYTDVPEFCCVLLASDGVKLGDSLLCHIRAKDSASVHVTFTIADSVDQAERSGLITRWVPKVAVPVAEKAAAAATSVVIPTPPRPELVHNTNVTIVSVTDLKRVFVLPQELQRQYDKAVNDVAFSGQTAAALSAPPSKGDLVLALYIDDVYYRALVSRTNVKADKYLVEYVDYGNVEITCMDKLRVCPQNLSMERCKPLVSQLEIECKYTIVPSALKYLERLKDAPEELKLTLPDNAASSPSGSAAILTVTKNNENVNNKVIEMCIPEWKKMELKGKDILSAKVFTIEDVEHTTLEGPELLVLGTMFLSIGQLHACALRDKHMSNVFGDLAGKFQQYCESEFGGKPYKPRVDELCFCKLDGAWVRAVMIQHQPGEPFGRVFCIDHALVEIISIQNMRKMVAEFVRGVPAVACEVQIKDYPADNGGALVPKAKAFMGITEESPRGHLSVEKVSYDDYTNMYIVEAPALLRALTQ